MSISLPAFSRIAAIENALTRWNSWYTGMDTPLTLIRGSHGVYSAPSSRYIHTSVTMAYTHTHRVNTGNLASDPKNIEVRRFIRPLLIIGLSWELIDEGLCSEESADLRSAISAWVRERSSWSSSLCFWISWMMTFILVSSMETFSAYVSIVISRSNATKTSWYIVVWNFCRILSLKRMTSMIAIRNQ